jgi:beta-glucosidase
LAIFTSLALAVTYIPLTPASQILPVEVDTALAGVAVPVGEEIYKDTTGKYSFAERAADLVSRMTAMEKASQVIGSMSSAIPRLGVAQYQWWNEALHGFAVSGGSGGVGVTPYPALTDGTSYPLSNALASTWDPELYYEEAVQISDEIRERALESKYNLTMYSPTVNLQRDPRWGRNEEGYSEDPYLTGIMGDAFVKGLEGKDFATGAILDGKGYKKAVSTIKHYTANNSENNRTGPLNGGAIEGGAANVDLRALREYYTAPYRNIAQSADVTSVMTAYSTVNAVPVSLSSYIMDTLLRQTFGFTGYITSDCDSVGAIMNHNYVNPYTEKLATVSEAFAQALAHGEDLECSAAIATSNGSYWTNMHTMLAEEPQTDKGKFTENQLDVSVWRLMKTRMELGEFDSDNPYEAEGKARLAAGLGGEYVKGKPGQTQARLDMADKITEKTVVLLKNSKAAPSDADSLLPIKAIPASYTDEAPYKVAIIGQMAQNTWFGQYSSTASSTDPTQSNFISIEKGIKDAFETKYGDRVEVAYYRGFTDSAAANALDSLKTLSEDDLAAAAAADLAIVVVGTNNTTNAEGRDRATIDLPGAQSQLASAVGKANSNTVVVIESCGPVQVESFEGDVKSILWAAFGGLRQGVGFGKVITGDVNPSAKTQQTWYKNVSNDGPSDLTSIYDYNLYATEGSKGRTYMYHVNDVSYPFGHGLSYTSFEYGDVSLDSASYDASDNGEATAEFTVKNTGATAGEEIVQLYVTQPGKDDPTKEQPKRRLMGFDKVALAPGEEKTVSISVNIEDLAFYDVEDDKYVVEPGAYRFEVGASSADIKKTADFIVTGAIKPVPATVTFYPNQIMNGIDDADLGIGERIVFSVGAEIQPRLAVAMNDESIYGWIVKDNIPAMDAGLLKAEIKETPLPAGASVSYESNRPAVVEVDIDGKIKAVAPGVATITATVTYNGESATGDFVVAVASDVAPTGITVEDESIGYDKEIKRYAVTVPDTDDAAPGNVEATAAAGSTCDITQAAGVPGKAVVEVTHDETGAQDQYLVGFLRAPRATKFTSGKIETLKDGDTDYTDNAATWSTLNPSSGTLSYTNDGVAIRLEQGTFAKPQKPQNVLMQEAAGNWVAKTHLSLSNAFTVAGQQAGLIMYDDDKNYIRFVCEAVAGASSPTITMRVYQAINGDETRVYTASIPGGTDEIYLQAQKDGRAYRFAYSFDDEVWTRASTQIPVIADMAIPQIGLWANNGDTASAPAVTATYEYLEMYDPAMVNPRLTGITMDSGSGPQSLTGFAPEIFDYRFSIKNEAGETVISSPPVIAATADAAYDVEVTNAGSLPGKAVIKVQSAVATMYYYVVFDESPTETTFVAGAKDDKWSVVKPSDPPAYSLEKGRGLKLTMAGTNMQGAAAGYSDLFIRPGGGPGWEIIAKVYYPAAPTVNYQSMGLYAWQDDNNYFGIDVRGYNGAQRAYITTEKNGAAATANVQLPAEATADDGSLTLYYKITRRADTYTAAYAYKDPSVDDNFIPIGMPSEIHLVDPQIALLAATNTSPVDVYCEYIGYTNNGNFPVNGGAAGMLGWALGNAVSTLSDSIPDKTDKDIVFAVPHGYDVVISGGGSSVAADGKVTQGRNDTTVALTFNVAGEFGRMSSFTKQVTIEGTGGGGAVTPTTPSRPGSGGGGAVTTPSAPADTTAPDGTSSGPQPVSGPLAAYSDGAAVAAWAQEYFARLIAEGVISGRTDGTLDPKGDVTRAEFTKMVVSALKITAGDTAKTFSADVREGDWYKQFVDIASSRGIVQGLSDDYFGAGDKISRQDLCVMLFRAAAGLGVSMPADGAAAFPDDAQIADYAKSAVNAMKLAGIVSGRTDGTFDPRAYASREETAKIICGIQDYIASLSAAPATDEASDADAEADADAASDEAAPGEEAGSDEAAAGDTAA